MEPLTKNQSKFFDLLKEYLRLHEESPTLVELQTWLEKRWRKFNSLNSIKQYIDSLVAAGYVLKDQSKNLRLKIEQQLIRIPVLGTKASCGSPVNFINESDIVDYKLVSQKLVENPDATFIFIADGDSMDKAGINSGDLLLVEVTENIVDGDIVLAVIDGCLTVKCLKKNRDTIELRPQSSNPIHLTMYFDETNDISIRGKVIRILSK